MSRVPPLPTTATIRDDVPGKNQQSQTENPMSVKPPIDFQRAFLRSKEHLLRTQPTLTPAERRRHLSLLSRNLPFRNLDEDDMLGTRPVPGGVGYGTFYTPDYKEAFATGTEIAWSAICQAALGGTSTKYLYITATNRSAYGVEALVAYPHPDECWFQVYDWSIPEPQDAQNNDPRWVVNLAYGTLNNYMQSQTINGILMPILPIYNSTKKIADGQWRNEVFLYDHTVSQWVSKYAREYATPDDAQHNAWVGSWAPIIEAFDTNYQNTNPLGVWNVQTRSADTDGNWSPWFNLSAQQAQPRNDGVGFQTSSLDPYFDWIVTS